MKKLLLIISILLLGLPSVISAGIPTGYTAYWNFDKINGSNSTFTPDELGLNNGTVSGPLNGSIGVKNDSYSFDGTNDFINITHSQTFNVSTNFSVVAWVYPKQIATRQMIVTKDSNTRGRSWALELKETGISPNMIIGFAAVNSSGTWFYAGPNTSIDVNKWHHVVGVKNDTHLIFYLDGVLNKSTAMAMPVNLSTSPIQIGAREYSTARNWLNGSVDEVYFYNKALSGTEVSDIYDYYFNQFSVNLSSPENNAYFQKTSNLTLNFSVKGDYYPYNCSLYINGALNQTNLSVQKNVITNFNLNFGLAGTYFWNVSCNNTKVTNVSETRNFTFEKTAYLVSNNSIGYTKLEYCLDAINNTGDGCVLNVSNYSETFSANKVYNFSGIPANQVLVIYGNTNVSVDFNGTNVSSGYNFMRLSDNQSIKNINILGPSEFVAITTGNFYAAGGLLLNNIKIQDYAYCLEFDSTSLGLQRINNSFLNCTTRNFNPYGSFVMNNVTSYNGEIRGACFGGGSITINNSIINSQLISGGSCNYNIISNSLFTKAWSKDNPATDTWQYSNITNNTFENITDADAVPFVTTGNVDADNNIENNTFKNCGNTTYSDTYLSSYSPFSYAGTDYTGFYSFYTADTGTSVSVSADNQDVSSVVTGTNSFHLWLCGAGVYPVTIFIENTTLYSCSAGCGAGGLNCDYYENNALVANGLGNNYTWQGSANVSGSYTSPPYLNYVNQSNYIFVPLRLSQATRFSIKGNTFNNGFGVAPMVLNGTSVFEISLNQFYDAAPYEESATNTNYCVNSEGNFYKETIMNVPSSDCGPSNITVPEENQSKSNVFDVAWKKQSSLLNVIYDLFIKKIGDAFTLINTTNTTGYRLNVFSYDAGNYTIKIVPYVNGSRINGTNVFRTFEIIPDLPPNLTSVLLNATSFFNRTKDNLIAYASGVSDPENDSIKLNYNWYKNGISETLVNMPMTYPDASNQVYDFSGYDNHGTVINSTFWNSTGGPEGLGAYDFNGINNIIYLPTPTKNTTGTNFTISLWIKPQGAQTNAGILLWGDSLTSLTPWIGIRKYSATTVAWYIDGNYRFSTSIPVSDGSWYNLVLTFAGHNSTNGIWRSYVNGALNQTPYSGLRGDAAHPGGHIYFGGGSIGAGVNYLNGSIGEFKVYNRTLSEQEVSMLYQSRGNTTQADALSGGDNWSVKVTPIDSEGINGTGVFSNNVTLAQDYIPTITSVTINATSPLNLSSDNLTAVSSGLSDANPDDTVQVNYNWYRNGISDTILNMPMTISDGLDRTYDFSGLDNHGNVSFGVEFNSTGGYDGFGAYDFYGTGNISVPAKNFNQNKGTISMWVKPRYQIGSENNLINRFFFDIGSPRIGWYVEGDGDTLDMVFITTIMTGPNISSWVPGQWHFIALSYDFDSDNYKVYVDGNLNKTFNNSLTTAAPSTNYFIGSRYAYAANNLPFNGTMDEVRIYNRTLSENEIKSIYQNKTNMVHSDATTEGENWSVKATPIDSSGFNGSGLFSNNLTINEQSLPALDSPQNEAIITERKPLFNWTYGASGSFNLLVDNNLDFSSPEINITTSDLNYTPTSDLYFDDYFWKVGVSGIFTESRNFTLIKSISCFLPANSVDFNSISKNEKKNTTGGTAIIIENSGNIKLNVSVNATSLWAYYPNPTQYYQYMISPNETGSFESALNGSWYNISNSTVNSITGLRYPDSNNSARIDIQIQAPESEGAGVKTSTIAVWCEEDE